MLVRLAVLGTIGYLGYRYLQQSAHPGQGDTDYRPLALAGGPLSESARIQSDPDAPPGTTSAASHTPPSA
jgi:hypothetical protein